MMDNQTLEKLRCMRLQGMAKAFEDLRANPAFSEFTAEQKLAFMVDKEFSDREERRSQRRLREAKFREPAVIEDIDWSSSRGLDKAQILNFTNCDWIRQRLNMVFVGKTGTGKTYLASALAHRACLEGFRARLYRLPRLFEDLTIARADGSWHKMLEQLAKFDVLILDEWGMPLAESQRRDLLEIIDDRHGSRSTIVTTQFEVEKWPEIIGDPTIADSVMDRLIHSAHIVRVSGGSQRKKKA